MVSPSTTRRDIATRLSLTLGGGGAGCLGVLAVIHKPSTAIIAIAGGIAVLAVNIIEIICKSLPEIIKTRGEAKRNLIKETAEAKALLMRTQTRMKLLEAGLDPDKTASAADMLRQQAIDTDLPRERRMGDDVLAKLHAAPRTRNPDRKPHNGPRNPGNGSSKKNVYPLHPDQLQLSAAAPDLARRIIRHWAELCLSVYKRRLHGTVDG